MVLAVNCPPQAPAPGQATHSSSCRSCVRHLAGGVLADALEHVDHGHVVALELAGQDRAAVHEHGRHVEAQHRHHHARQRLVAAGEPDHAVVAVAAHGELDRIGDHLARDQRRLHALVAHGDAVGHGDGAELARRAAGGVDALLGGLRLAHQGDVAGRGLVPARHHADERPMDLLLGETHGVVVGAVRRARGALGDVAAGKLGLVECPCVHVSLLLASVNTNCTSARPRRKWATKQTVRGRTETSIGPQLLRTARVAQAITPTPMNAIRNQSGKALWPKGGAGRCQIVATQQQLVNNASEMKGFRRRGSCSLRNSLFADLH